MSIIIRKAGNADARQMSELLNEIIKIGGTTAIVNPVSTQDIADWISASPGESSWVVAEDDTGKILGFQMLVPHVDLPDDAADIATFVRVGAVQLGIGSKLFETSRMAAKQLGYAWINATIRADNSGGLAYYGSRGFETYKTDDDVNLQNDQRVGKVHRRYTL